MTSLQATSALRQAVSHAQLRAAPSCVARVAALSTTASFPPPPPTPALAASRTPAALRSLHSSAALHKKGRAKGEPKVKKNIHGADRYSWTNPPPERGERLAEPEASSGGQKHPDARVEDVFDFIDVHSRLEAPREHFEGALRTLRTGGRFNPDAIGSLPVQIKTTSEESGKKGSSGGTTTITTHPLRDLAAVVPRGGAGSRSVSILCHEEASVKAVMSAVQASPDFNQQPQRDPDGGSPNELILRVEPESREDLRRRASELCHAWRERIRAVRHYRMRLQNDWNKKDRTLHQDDRRTADELLEKIIKNENLKVDDRERQTLMLLKN